jgi:hypothetical protein
MKLELYDSDKLNFVELNITGDGDDYTRVDEESKFLDAEVYNLFASCFERSNKLYDYYESTRYNARQFIPLRNALVENLNSLNSIDNKEYFVEYISQIFLGTNFILKLDIQDKNWCNNWEYYYIKLKSINQDLIALVDRCISEERILWVIGY